MKNKMDNLIEILADIEHQRWGHWQKYVFDLMMENKGKLKMEYWNRWNRQIKTDYKDLSEKEKESDRKEVRKYIYSVIQEVLEDVIGGETSVEYIQKKYKIKNRNDAIAMAYHFNTKKGEEVKKANKDYGLNIK